MIGHDRALELAAAAIDFGLSPADDAALTDHLAGCVPCRETAAALRTDAAAITALDHEAAPADLRDRILGAVAVATDEQPQDEAPQEQSKVVRFPRNLPRLAY